MAQRSYAVITGAGRGIGLALVRAYIEQTDYHIIAISRSPGPELSALEQHADRLAILPYNICTDSGLDSIAAFVKSNGEVRILVHNAGALLYKPFSDISRSELEYVYRVNVFAPFMLTQKLMPYFSKAHIINVSSVGGVQGSMKFGGLSAYSSSKAALCCLTEMWSEEFKDTPHTFNCLALGSVNTEMFRTAFPGVEAASTPDGMASYIVHFSREAPKVMRGKIISLSLSNP